MGDRDGGLGHDYCSGGGEMTDTQLLVMLGTIWIAPHAKWWYGQLIGCIILIVAACKGLGWL